MALLRTQIVRKVQNQAGSAIANANATIYSLPDNSLATVYTNETGTATYTQPLQSGLDGSFAGWLELGDYSITIASSAGTSTSRYYANHPQQSYLETYGNDVPLTIKAGTALTSNMAEWKDASGSTVMSVSTAGSITSPTIAAIQGSVTNVVTQPIGTVNATPYVIGLSDAGKLLNYTYSSQAGTITIPTNGSVAFPIGQKIDFIFTGHGVGASATFVGADSSVTVRGNPFWTMKAKGAKSTLIKIGTDEWSVSGDLEERDWIRYSTSNNYWGGIAASNGGQYISAVSNGTVLLRSSNYGTAWSTATAGSSVTTWQAIAMGTTGQYQTAVDGNYGGDVWTSSNYGTAWTARVFGTAKQLKDVAISGDGQYQYVTAYNDYIYRSTNYGVNWASTNTGVGAQEWQSISCSASGQRVTAADSFNGYIYTSSDYGNSWTQRTGPGQQSWSAVAVAPYDGSIQYAAALNQLWKSIDSGISWTKLQVPFGVFNINALACSYFGTKIIIQIYHSGYVGFVYSSEDGGYTWTQRLKNSNYTMNYGDFYYTQEINPKLFLSESNSNGLIYQIQDML